MNKTILIVDDSATDRQLLIRILKEHPYTLITAETGEEAISLSESHQPDCILMDVVMPAMNGFEATRHLKKTASTQHIPVIMVSSKDQEIDKVWSQKQGARAYITKPVVEQALINTVDEVVN